LPGFRADREGLFEFDLTAPPTGAALYRLEIRSEFGFAEPGGRRIALRLRELAPPSAETVASATSR